jgi:hypothetical protein
MLENQTNTPSSDYIANPVHLKYVGQQVAHQIMVMAMSGNTSVKNIERLLKYSWQVLKQMEND